MEGQAQENPGQLLLASIFENKSEIPDNAFSSFALSDAKHDFHGKHKINGREIDFDIDVSKAKKGLPNNGGNAEPYNEDNILFSILGHNKELLGDNKKNYVDIKAKLPDVTWNPQTAPANITVQIKEGTKTYEGDRYTAVRFDAKKYRIGQGIPPGQSNEYIGQDILINTGLCPNGSAIFVLDFYLKWFESLVDGKKRPGGREYDLHYTMTPEMANDPAKKLSVSDVIFKKKSNNGVHYHSYVQTEASNMIYNHFNNQDFPDSFFLSKYDFNLGPIQAQYKKGKAGVVSRYTVNMAINWTDENNKPYTSNIVDCEESNSIATIVGYLTNIISRIGQTIRGVFGFSSSNEELFNYNSKLQQKRCGDWFQILCCHKVYNREFTKILPEDADARKAKKYFESGDIPVYLITHDRIALAYGLMMGINVVFTDYEGGFCIFKNMKSAAGAGSKPVFLLLKDKLMPKLSAAGGSALFSAEQMREIETYNEKRTSIIQSYKAAVMEILTGAITYQTSTKTFKKLIDEDLFEPSQIFGTPGQKDSMKIQVVTRNIKFIKETIEKLFKAIVMYVFAVNNLLDVEKDYQLLNNRAKMDILRTISESEEDTAKIQTVIDINDAYERITNILNNFEISTGAAGADTTETRITRWIENFRNNQVYKSAKLADLISDRSKLDAATLKALTVEEIGGNEVAIKNNRFDFLPFVSTIPNEMRRPINKIFSAIINQIKPFVSDPITSRTNEVKPVFSYMNTLANFIIQAKIHLPVEPERELIADAAGVVDETAGSTVSAEVEAISEPVVAASAAAEEPMFSEEDILLEINNLLIDILVEIDNEMEEFLTTNFFTEEENEAYNAYFTEHSIMYADLYGPATLEFKESAQRSQRGGRTSRVDNSDNIFCDISPHAQTRPLLNYFLSRGSENAMRYITSSGLQPMSLSPILGGKNRARFFGGAEKRIVFDERFGHHPMLPIYMILSAVSSCAENNWEHETYYSDYVNILGKMQETLYQKYLKNPLEKGKILEGYIIGFALKVLFFNSHKSTKTFEMFAKEILHVPEEDYRSFSLCNSGFSNHVSGSFSENRQQLKIGRALLRSKVFRNFIQEINLRDDVLSFSKKVKIGTGSGEQKISIVGLKNHVFQLMKRNVNIVREHHKGVRKEEKTLRTMIKPISLPAAAIVGVKKTSVHRKKTSTRKVKSAAAAQTRRRTKKTLRSSFKKYLSEQKRKKKTSSTKRKTSSARRRRTQRKSAAAAAKNAPTIMPSYLKFARSTRKPGAATTAVNLGRVATAAAAGGGQKI